jgi:ribonuclease P protein component
VLTRENRLTSSLVFSETVREGRRAGTRTLVVHLVEGRGAASPKVGLVVGRAVGGAVTRNLVKRRLRHLAHRRLDSLPASAVLVIRALPAAGRAPFGVLADDLDRALGRLSSRSASTTPGHRAEGAAP